MLCYVMLCYVMLCYVMLCYVMLCYVMLCYVRLGSFLLYFIILCCVVLCCIILHYITVYYITIITLHYNILLIMIWVAVCGLKRSLIRTTSCCHDQIPKIIVIENIFCKFLNILKNLNIKRN